MQTSPPTNHREEEHEEALNDLQAALGRPAGQAGGAQALVTACGVPEGVLPRPPQPTDQEEAPRKSVALEATHDALG